MTLDSFMDVQVPKILFSDFAIVTCPTKANNMLFLNQLNTDNNLFKIMSCNSQLWMGEKKDFDPLPEDFKKNYVLTGEKAYSFLLEYLLGMRGNSDGESQVVNQGRKAWGNFQKINPNKARSLETVWHGLLNDSAAIRTNITSKLQPARIENTAVHISGQGGGETILVVGDVKNDVLGDGTRNIIRHLGNNRKKRVERILFTNPDDAALKIMENELNLDKKNGSIVSQIEAVSFKDFLHNRLYEPKIVYIAYPMGKSDEVDTQLLGVTNQRAAMSKYTVHIRGNPLLRGESSNDWKNNTNKLDGYYKSPEDLQNANKAEIERNKNIKDEGALACKNCAISRTVYNKKPIYSSIGMPTEDYLSRTGMSKQFERKI